MLYHNVSMYMYLVNYYYISTGWVDGSLLSELPFYQLDRVGNPVEVTFCLKVKDDLSWTLHFRGMLINREGCSKIKEIPYSSNSDLKLVCTYN